MDIKKKWYEINAEGIVLGRLAAFIAMRLRGKHQCAYSPHIDCGDHIIVTHADKIILSGQKLTDKIYYRHTGYPGGLKEKTAQDILNGKTPEKLLYHAVRLMLPKESPLARKQLSNLYIYAGETHPHAGQKPEKIDFKKLDKKNSVRAA